MKSICIFVTLVLGLVINTGIANCPIADLTGDCYVDLSDLVLMAENWLVESGDCPKFDLSGDCRVDSEDLARVSEQWLTGNRLLEDMTLIPSGSFQMGDSFNEGDSDELPLHTVVLDSFALGKYEITNAQYCTFLNMTYPTQLKIVGDMVYASSDISSSYPFCDTSTSSGSQIAFMSNTFSVRNKGTRDMSNDPMVCVSWYGAVAYCNWRSQQEGKQLCYNLSSWTCDFTKNGYRLPTEAEWEYATRDELTDKRFPWDDMITHSQANYFSNSTYPYDISPTPGYHPSWNDGITPYTSPVGSFSANGYGLSDMAGNVWEWCNDWFGKYDSSTQTNPIGPVLGGLRVIRGGGWRGNSFLCRTANRGDGIPGTGYDHVGFRIELNCR